MNAKLRKLVKITAAGLFLIALAININVTLNDPFSMLSEQALADETTAYDANATGSDGEPITPGPGTPQAGKYDVAVKTESTTYGKFTVNGTWVILSSGAEGGYSRTVTKEWTCCGSGGNNCSTNNPNC